MKKKAKTSLKSNKENFIAEFKKLMASYGMSLCKRQMNFDDGSGDYYEYWLSGWAGNIDLDELVDKEY